MRGDGATARELLAVALASIAYLGLSNFRESTFIWQLSPQEGGLWLDEAVRVLRGERIYRDFFDFVAPLNVLLIAAALALGGSTPAMVGTLIVAIGAIGATLVHAVSSHLMPAAWRWCATALFVVYLVQPYSPLNHKGPTVALVLGGILLLAGGRSGVRCLVAGALLAAATLSTQDMGAGAAAGIALALGLLARESPLPFAQFVGGYVATLVAAMAALAAWVGLENLWYHVVVFPATRYGNAVSVVLEFGDPHAAVRTFTIYALVVIGALGAVVLLLRRRWRDQPFALVLAAGAGMGLLMGSFSRPIEPLSIGVRATPLIIFALGLGWQLLEATRRQWMVTLFLAATIGATGAFQLVHAQWIRTLARAEHPAGAIWETRRLSELDWLERTSPPGSAVFLFPYLGGHEFLSHARNVSSFPMVLDMNFSTPEQVRAASHELGSRCPRAGLWNHRGVHEPTESSTLRALYQAIRLDYDSRGEVAHGIEAFTRKADRPCPELAGVAGGMKQ